MDQAVENGKPMEAANKRMADLENHFRKKREAEKRALTIIERLLGDGVSEEFLVDAAKFINPEYYNDAVVERSIIKLCGYPLCTNSLKNIPKQKYHISLKTNRVYDISERKNYCSSWCFQASTFFKKQLQTSPLWERQKETVNNVKLLQKSQKCATNHNVDLREGMVSTREVELLEKDVIIPLSSEQNVEPSETENDDLVAAFVAVDIQDKKPKSATSKSPSTEVKEKKMLNSSGDQKSEQTKTDPLLDGIKNDPEGKDAMQSCGVQGLEKSTELCVEVTHAKGREDTPAIQPLERTEHEVLNGEWLTDRSRAVQPERELDRVLITLSEYVTRFTQDFFVQHKHCVLPNKDSFSKSSQVNETSGFSKAPPVGQKDEEESCTVSKKEKLPDFVQLQQDAKLQQLRVREFFTGSFIYPSKEDVSDDTKEMSGSYVKEGPGKEGEELGKEEGHAHEGEEHANENETVAHVLPPIDSHSQNAIRRKILVERLYKSLPDLLPHLGLTLQDVSTDLRLLVSTLSTTNQNIVLKPRQWTLMASLFVILLGRKNVTIQQALQSPDTKEFLSSIFNPVGYSVESVFRELDIILTFQHLVD